MSRKVRIWNNFPNDRGGAWHARSLRRAWSVAAHARRRLRACHPEYREVLESPMLSIVPGSGSFVPELLQDLAEEPFHPVPDPGLLSLAVAGHVQRPDLVFCDPRCDV